jgi:hypothetical protein
MDFSPLESKLYHEEFSNLIVRSPADVDQSVSETVGAAVLVASMNMFQQTQPMLQSIIEKTSFISMTSRATSLSVSPLKINKKLNTNTTHYFRHFRDHRVHSFYYPIEKYLSYYTLVLIVIGTICNLTSFLIMHKKNMSKHSCMRYLSILSLTDVIVLYQWNLNTFFKYNLSIPPVYSDLEEISLFWCRWISYLAFSSLELSSWLLSLVSFDRFMIIYSRWWRTHIMNEPKIVNLIIVCLSSFIFLLNSHLLFLNGYTVKNVPKTGLKSLLGAKNATNFNFNSTIFASLHNTTSGSDQARSLEEVVVCYRSLHDNNYIFPNWQRVHLFM